MTLGIATRKSPLAVWQAEYVAGQLTALRPELDVELVRLSTKGDKILDQALSKVGGKDLFVKEIEAALLDGRAQVAVHSLKDVPTVLPEGLILGAYPPREDPRDALVSPQGYTVETLPQGAKVGTCSLRRASQLLSHRPDLQICEIRGNVQTRLKRMKEQNMDATVLAYAGLKRLEMVDIVSQILEPEVCLPAIGQGILAVEVAEADKDVLNLVTRLDDPAARAAAVSERAFLHHLEGGCQVPIAAHAKLEGEKLWLRGLVAALDGQTIIRSEIRGPIDEAKELGIELATELLQNGAEKILQDIGVRAS